jgi:hypothetical protein
MRLPRLEVVITILLAQTLFVASLSAQDEQNNINSLADTVMATAPLFEFSTGAGAFTRTQPPEPKPRRARRSALLVGLCVSYGVLQAPDAHATIRALHCSSVREETPIVSPFASQPAALIAFKAGVTAGTIRGIDRLNKSHPRLAIVTFGVTNIGHAYLVQRNYRDIPAR